MLRDLGRRVELLRRHERLLMISAATVLVMAGQGVIAPVLPLFARQFGVGASTIGLTLSSFALARLILNVPLGVLADRRGRRLLLAGGPLVTSAGMVGSGLALNIWQLLAWRFVAGAGSAMYMTGAMIYLADISTRENRARFLGTNQGALLLGVSIGPAIGGALAEGWGLRAPFFAVGAAALIAAAYAYLRLPETRGLARAESALRAAEAMPQPAAPAGGAAPPPLPAPRAALLRMVRSLDFVAAALFTMATFFTRSASQQTMVPLIGYARLAISPGKLGAIFSGMALLNLVLITPAAIAGDRFGRKAVIIPSGIVTAVGLALYAGAGTMELFLLASLVFALGSSIAGPAPAAYVADIAPDEARGLAMGVYRTTGDFGLMVGPPLLGLIADASSFGWALAANALLMGAAALLFVFARETLRRPGAAAPAVAPTSVEGGDR
ncbi:MAG: MFS transporter [Dehalococcoidia bacterium]|nr:MFS transporter [Dehalococcoidia bacterium]